MLLHTIQSAIQNNKYQSWSCSKAVYKPVWHIPLLSVQWINSWLWTEELSETCRVLWQNKFVKLSASSWFYYRDSCFFTENPSVRWQYTLHTKLVCINNFRHTLNNFINILYSNVFYILMINHYKHICKCILFDFLNFTSGFDLAVDMYHSCSLRMALWELKQVRMTQRSYSDINNIYVNLLVFICSSDWSK